MIIKKINFNFNGDMTDTQILGSLMESAGKYCEENVFMTEATFQKIFDQLGDSDNEHYLFRLGTIRVNMAQLFWAACAPITVGKRYEAAEDALLNARGVGFTDGIAYILTDSDELYHEPLCES